MKIAACTLCAVALLLTLLDFAPLFVTSWETLPSIVNARSLVYLLVALIALRGS